MEENEIISSEKNFKERMKIWADKHSITSQKVDEVSKKWSSDNTAEFFADCDPASIDVMDELDGDVQKGDNDAEKL